MSERTLKGPEVPGEFVIKQNGDEIWLCWKFKSEAEALAFKQGLFDSAEQTGVIELRMSVGSWNPGHTQ